MQAKLLFGLLQDRQFERLGGTKNHFRRRARLGSDTPRSRYDDRAQPFPADLFYRLNVIPLWLPPLRARREDIEVLVNHFCRTFGQANGRPEITIDPAALRLLRSQRWPGNVRQLQNCVERLVVLATDPIIGEDHVRSELAKQIAFESNPGHSKQFTKRSSSAPPKPSDAADAADAGVIPLSAE